MSHPNVVGYVAHGMADDGAPYLAMEWLEGCDLAARLAKGPVSEADALRMCLRAAQGVAAAHAQGVLHRDIKPSNLFLVDDQPDAVKVLDFGIAGRHDAASRLTHTGAVLGTPAYMAPEQARGLRELTPRVDVFALGCVLFECLAGAPAFEGDSANAVLALVLSGATPELSQRRPGSSPALSALLSRMMAFEPADRFADAALAALAISDVLSGASSGVHEVGRAAVGRRGARSHSTLLIQTGPGAALPANLIERATSFGGELAHEDATGIVVTFEDENAAMAARRAALCALELVRTDASLRVTLRSDRDATPAVTPVATLEAVDATRPAPGAILLDDATASLLGREFVLRREASSTWLVGSRESHAGAIVGRTRELALLEGLFSEVDGEHCARLVLVLGEAGIGKSHLIQAAVSRRATGTARVLWARADRPTRTSPFAVLRQLARDALPAEERAADGARQRVVERLVAQRWTRSDAEYFCELAALPGEADEAVLGAARRDPLVMASGIRGAWLAFMGAELRAGPLVCVVEDLHFADAASVRLLEVALAEFAEERLLAIVSARPEEAESELAMLQAREPEVIRLQPLRANVAAELVRALLASSNPALTGRILDRGVGHPLRLVELARLAQEGGSLDAPGDAAIEARLGRLKPDVQRVLRAASVLGTQFSLAGVAHLLGGVARQAEVEALLDAAISARVVTPISRGEGEAFQFSHGLVQEASYASLRHEDRKSAHAAAADWLSQRAGADASLIAWHFDRAGERDRALVWYEAAARAAFAGADLARAFDLSGKALECGPVNQALASVLHTRAECAWARGDIAEGRSAAQRAFEAARPGSLIWMSAAGTLVTSAGQRGDNDAVAALADTVRAQPYEPDAFAGHVVCLCRAGTQLLHAGRLEAAMIRRHLADTTKADAQASAWLATLDLSFHSLAHDYESAIRSSVESARLHAAVGDARMSAYIRNFKAGVQVFAGDFSGALQELDLVDAVARRAGADLVARWARYTRAKVVSFYGDPAAARVLLEQVPRILEGNPRIIAGAHIHGAIAALRAGDAAWTEAEARAARAAHSSPGIAAAALAAMALAQVLAGRAEEALASAREASALLGAGPMLENESLVHLALSEALAAHGEQAEARTTVELATDRLLGIAMKFSTRAAREAYLHGIHTHARTMQLASRLGLHVDIP